MMNEILLKVVVIGNSGFYLISQILSQYFLKKGVGKTSILNSFIKKEFNASLQSTTGASFLSKSILYRNQLVIFQVF